MFMSSRDPVMISVDLILMIIGDFEDRDLVQCTGSEEAGWAIHLSQRGLLGPV